MPQHPLLELRRLLSDNPNKLGIVTEITATGRIVAATENGVQVLAAGDSGLRTGDKVTLSNGIAYKSVTPTKSYAL